MSGMPSPRIQAIAGAALRLRKLQIVKKSGKAGWIPRLVPSWTLPRYDPLVISLTRRPLNSGRGTFLCCHPGGFTGRIRLHDRPRRRSRAMLMRKDTSW